MQLIDELERRAAREQSMFQAQLLREDLARLRKLQQLAKNLDRQEFIEQGMRIGWTQADARTAELREPLEALLSAVHALERGHGNESEISQAWLALHRMRMERLLGCLSTPLPKPAD